MDRAFKQAVLLSAILFITRVGMTQPVVLNELMSANNTTIADEDGDYPDWIELYNAGGEAVDLTGYGLSDDKSNLFRWILPRGVLLPQQFQLIFLSGKDRTLWVRHWETVILPEDIWRYHTGQTPPGAGWQTLVFDDHTWLTGPGGIGFGDNDDATVIEPVISVFMRRKFTLSDASQVTAMLLHMDYDDAFVAYLNGIEVARANIGTPGTEPGFNQPASDYREAEIYQGGKPERFDLGSFIPMLNSGENILSVEVHNYGSTSSDLSAIPFLTLGLSVIPADPRGMPDLLAESCPRLHAGFKISSDGEALYLTGISGILTDSIPAVTLLPDKSYGRKPDGSGQWVYFDDATPESANSQTGYTGFTPAPDLSRESGFYPGPVMVRITAPDPESQIYYTTNGSAPDEQKNLFTADLLISKMTIIRCRVFEAGKLPGPERTATYFIGETQNLPVISITTDPDNLFSEDDGIYVMGNNAEPDFPYFGANFWQDREIPVYLEFFDTDQISGFSEAAGLKITGAWNRGFPQKSLAVYFRGEYGNTSLHYQLFPDQDITVYDNFILRNSGNDWGDTFIRDAVMTSIGRKIGLEAQDYRPVVVYINGDYWGIHNLREKINEDFLAAHRSVDRNNLDLLEDNMVVLEGDDEHYRDLMDIIANQDITRPEVYTDIDRRMDIQNFIDYEILEIFIGNTDWPGNNIKFWHPRTGDGKWRWILFDTDFAFGLFNDSPVSHNTLALATDPNGPPDWPNPPWSTLLLRRLLENNDFRLAFITRFADLLNTALSSAEVRAVISAKKAAILPEIERHYNRWNLDPAAWDTRIDKLNEYAIQRPAYIRLYLIQKFGLTGMIPIQINIFNPEGGSLRLNSVDIVAPSWQGLFFMGVPICITAIPETGWRFDRWSGDMESEVESITVIPSQPVSFSAAFVRDTSITINEINYNSAPSHESGDWIEFINAGHEPVNMSGWQFRDEDDLHVFEFPDNLILDSGGLTVICNDSAAFRDEFPAVQNLCGMFGFGLSGKGELIRLYDNEGSLVDSLSYGVVAPWPETADGQGPTLALRRPDLDNSRPENWFASKPYGSPGQPNQDPDGIVRENLENIPAYFSVGPAYPNPFNPETAIPVNLPLSGKIRLAIYDLTGRLVTTLHEGRLAAGKYTFRWRPGGWNASGIYFYVLHVSDGRTASGKLVLLR